MIIDKPGIYNISNEEYHAHPAISRSGIMEFRKTPKHYWWKYLSPVKLVEKESPAKALGHAFHTLVLEPHLFDMRFFITKKIDKRTKDGKDYWASIDTEKGNREIICESAYEEIKSMADTIRKDEIKFEMISGARYEQSIFWIDEDTGLMCKARPDILHEHFVVDLKSAASANPVFFEGSITEYGYHLQFAMINDGIKAVSKKDIEEFYFLVVEKDFPYIGGVYPLGDEAIEQGKKDYKKALVDIKQCMENNHWPEYEIDKPVSIRKYAFS